MEDNKRKSEESVKRSYHKPQLSLYGDIKTITLNVGNTSMPDGGPVNGMDMSKP